MLSSVQWLCRVEPHARTDPVSHTCAAPTAGWCLTLLRFTLGLPFAQEEEKKQGSLSKEEIKKPDPAVTEGMRHGTYDKLDDDGLCPPGAGPGTEPVLFATHRNRRPRRARVHSTHISRAQNDRAVAP